MLKIGCKKLAQNISKQGFEYNLVVRDEKKCIYSQKNKRGLIVGYEVFKIKKSKYAERMRNFAINNNSPIDENWPEFSELFPSDNSFGKHAWSYPNLETAQKKYMSL